MPDDLQLVVSALKQQDADAIVLGGSYCIGLQSDSSDIDICIYYDKEINIPVLNQALMAIDDDHKKAILLPLNTWGIWQNSGGVCVLNGKEYDITLRNLSFVEQIVNECISGSVYRVYNAAYPFGYCSSYLVGEMDNAYTLYESSERLAQLQKRIKTGKDLICCSIIRTFLDDAIFQCICGIKAESTNDSLYRNTVIKNAAFSLLNVYTAQKKVLLFHNKRASQRALAAYRNEKASAVLGNIQFIIRVLQGEMDNEKGVVYSIGKLILHKEEEEQLILKSPMNYTLLQMLVASR